VDRREQAHGGKEEGGCRPGLSCRARVPSPVVTQRGSREVAAATFPKSTGVCRGHTRAPLGGTGFGQRVRVGDQLPEAISGSAAGRGKARSALAGKRSRIQVLAASISSIPALANSLISQILLAFRT